jgi:hypothetical protein
MWGWEYEPKQYQCWGASLSTGEFKCVSPKREWGPVPKRTTENF